MNYMKLQEFLKSYSIVTSKNILSDPDVFKIVIEHNQREFYRLFDSMAFNKDNLIQIINSSTEQELLTLPAINLYGFQEDDKKEVICLLLNNGYYAFLKQLRLTREIVADDSLLQIFLNNIDKYEMDISFINEVFYLSQSKPVIIEGILAKNRLDLLALLLSTNTEFSNSKDLLSIVKHKSESIFEFARFFNLAINPYKIYEDKELFDFYFYNGYYEIMFKIDNELRNHLSNNAGALNKIIDYAKKYDKAYFDILFKSNIEKAENSNELLKILISKRMYKYLNNMNPVSWDIESSLSVMNDYSISSQDINYKQIPLFNYYHNYIYRHYDCPKNYKDAKDINNILDVDICKKISFDITSGHIEVDKNLFILYNFLSQESSPNICKLAFALLEGSLSNISKLITEEGITEYFKNYLMYDYDYIKKHNDSIEKVDQNYITYLNMILLDTSIYQSFVKIPINHQNIDKYISDNTITRKTIEKLFNSNNMDTIITLDNCGYHLQLTEIERKIIEIYKLIPSKEQQQHFINYCERSKETITIEKVDMIYRLIIETNNSNSHEIRKQSDQVVSKLINSPYPEEELQDIEDIFTDGTTPDFLKRFAMYKILKKRKITNDSNVTSPILKSVSEEDAESIILNDLLRISLANNSRDIINYLGILENGLNLYCSKNKNEYTEDDKKLLSDYRRRLEFICDTFIGIEYEETDDDYETVTNIKQAYLRKKNWHLEPASPIIDNFILQDISDDFPSKMMMQMYMQKHDIIKTAIEEGRNLRGDDISLEEGDFLKGIDSNYLDNMFTYGCFSKEFLKEDITEDLTHLDTDLSRLYKSYSDIPSMLADRQLEANAYNDMKLIISKKTMEEFQEFLITKDVDGEKKFSDEDKRKTEVFQCGTGNHYAFRTGFPMTYVKGIIATRNFDRARFIISKNSFYVPLYDATGKLIYSYEEYLEDRKKLQGLSYYQEPKYQLSPNLINDDIINTARSLHENNQEIEEKKKIIFDKIRGVLSKYFKGVSYEISNRLERGIIEIIDTGSTGRGTNTQNNYDFDFILRVDESFLKSAQLQEFSKEIYQTFNKQPNNTKVIRLDDVYIEGIEEPLKIEMTIIGKNNNIEYSTDMCIRDRLENIFKQHMHNFLEVLANIVFAKEFFKKIECYKPYNGGFGGVGVENFILQNGGSFIDAITNFLQVAENSTSLEDFKRKYHIYDYGKNHYSYAEDNYKRISFPYDDYASRLNDKSYNTMIDEFKKYIETQKHQGESTSKK